MNITIPHTFTFKKLARKKIFASNTLSTLIESRLKKFPLDFPHSRHYIFTHEFLQLVNQARRQLQVAVQQGIPSDPDVAGRHFRGLGKANDGNPVDSERSS